MALLETKGKHQQKGGGSNNTQKRKRGGGGGGRQYNNNGAWKNNNNMNNRLYLGSSGLLITCETRQERKCKMESLDMLHEYYESKNNNNDNDNDKSLEDEIANLKASNKKSPFICYNTGCKGLLWLQYVPYHTVAISVSVNNNNNNNEDIISVKNHPAGAVVATTNDDNDDEEIEEKKKPRYHHHDHLETHVNVVDENYDNTTTKHLQQPFPITDRKWDPLEFVNYVKTAKMVTSSRYIIRMVPMQVTCKVSEIMDRIKPLIQSEIYSVLDANSSNVDDPNNNNRTSSSASTFNDDKKKTSFCVVVKKRNCTKFSGTETKRGIASLFDDNKFRVEFDDPQFTIIIEVCKTIAGLSIVRGSINHTFKKFNLLLHD